MMFEKATVHVFELSYLSRSTILSVKISFLIYFATVEPLLTHTSANP